jgi:cytochrome P450
VGKILNQLPDRIVKKMNPQLAKLLNLRHVSALSRISQLILIDAWKDLRAIISRIGKEQEQETTKTQQATIFHEVLQSDLPLAEKSLLRLGDEAQNIVGAGLETTAWTLTNATFYILNSPQILKTLREELHSAMPDPASPLNYQRLESLPYLRACIREAIRLSLGVASRNPRVLSSASMYRDWNIPAFVPISMTILDVHRDESIYPDPHSFIPERWLDNPKAPDGSALDRYFVAFGKGPRSCLGIK